MFAAEFGCVCVCVCVCVRVFLGVRLLVDGSEYVYACVFVLACVSLRHGTLYVQTGATA